MPSPFERHVLVCTSGQTEGRWYAAVRVEDVAEIVETELKGRRPVERLLYAPAKPGKNVCKAGETPGTIAPFVPPSTGTSRS